MQWHHGGVDEKHDEQVPEAREVEPEWKRRRRLAEIFGDVLPGTTRDERDPGQSGSRESGTDAWLRSQVPPHHGGH